MKRIRSKSLLALALATLLAGCGVKHSAVDPASGPSAGVYPTKALTITAPAKLGAGWDLTARDMQKVLTTAGLTRNTVDLVNVPGEVPGNGGTAGLAKFVDDAGSDPHQLLVMGLVMIGAILLNKSPVDLDQVTPIATLTSEYVAIVVPAASKYQTIQDLMADVKASPDGVVWAGGSRGGAEHILVGLLARAASVDVRKLRYDGYAGGGEVIKALGAGRAQVGVSGVSQFSEQVAAGALRVLAVSSQDRLPGIDAPTLRSAGFDVVFANWRGIVAAKPLSDPDRAAVNMLVRKMHESPQWKQTLQERGWADFYVTGAQLDAFLAEERERIKWVLTETRLLSAS